MTCLLPVKASAVPTSLNHQTSFCTALCVLQESLDRERVKLEEVLKAEIKARKHHDKALADGLAAAEAKAARELAALAEKCEAAVAGLEKKSEGLAQGQQQLARKQTELAGSCQELDKVCACFCKCCASQALIACQIDTLY
jgi:hypothetical protein